MTEKKEKIDLGTAIGLAMLFGVVGLAAVGEGARMLWPWVLLLVVVLVSAGLAVGHYLL